MNRVLSLKSDQEHMLVHRTESSDVAYFVAKGIPAGYGVKVIDYQKQPSFP